MHRNKTGWLAATGVCVASACLVSGGCSASSSSDRTADSGGDLRRAAESTRPQPVLLGHCPTMRPHAQRIGDRAARVVLKELGTAARALQDLRGTGSDAALIGRLARASELDETAVEVRLGSGHTLIRRVGSRSSA